MILLLIASPRLYFPSYYTIVCEWKVTDSNQRHLAICLLYTSPSPRDVEESRMPSSA